MLLMLFQVSEILSEEKCRLSVSGWFHGPPIERPARYIEAPLPRSPHIPYDVSNHCLLNCISISFMSLKCLFGTHQRLEML